jgi:guanylate kinase
MADTPREITIKRRGLMLVLSSPSGAGKTTLSRALLRSDKNISLSISYTTRKRRPSEVDGVDYHFVDDERFQAMVGKHAFLEHAVVFGNRYGTPAAEVEEMLQTGKDVLFDVDWQGTQQLKKKARPDLASVFILPPSIPSLESRLRTRAQDSAEVVAERMKRAQDEISHWIEYDYVVINQDVGSCLAEIGAILAAERLRRTRRVGLEDFVKGLGR